jgi:glycerophosphoryl diester phosphodiesterase
MTIEPRRRLAVAAAVGVVVLGTGGAPVLTVDVHAHRGGAGLAPENTLAAFRNALALGVDYLEMDLHVSASPNFRLIGSEVIDALHRAGIPVVPWTVNDPADMGRLLDAGIGRHPGDGIITDYPDRLIQVLQARGLRR